MVHDSMDIKSSSSSGSSTKSSSDSPSTGRPGTTRKASSRRKSRTNQCAETEHVPSAQGDGDLTELFHANEHDEDRTEGDTRSEEHSEETGEQPRPEEDEEPPYPDEDEYDDEEEARMAMGAFEDEMDEEGFLDDYEGGSLALNLRAMAGFLSGGQSKYRNLLSSLRNRKDPTAQLMALQELSEALSLASEDTLAGYFQTEAFVRELVYIMGGPKPPAPSNAGADASTVKQEGGTDDVEDEDMLQALAAAGLADQGTMVLLACRCLANLIEAMPHTAHTVVSCGAVPVLLSKLMEIEFIDLAEQTLQTLEKVSVDYPTSIIREGGLMAMLQYLDFFNIHIQRTAMTAVSHCCRKLSAEHFDRVRDVVPIIRTVLTYADQRLVESACKCVVRMVDSYKHQVDLLEMLLDQELVQALNAHLLQGTPSSTGSARTSTSTSIGPSIYTEILKSLGTAVRASPKIAITLLEANAVETLYHLLTGSNAPAEDGSGGRGPAAITGDGPDGSVAPAAQLESNDPSTADAAAVAVVGQSGIDDGSIAVADMAVLQNLAHRPKEQVQEALNLVSELLPPLPRDGVFDPRAYTEKAWIRRRKAERSNREKAKAKTLAAANGESSNAADDEDLASVPATTSPDEMAKPEKVVVKSEKDLIKEEAQLRRSELLAERPHLTKRFTQLLLPTLVEVYAASVALHVRHKVLTGMLKIVAFVDAEPLAHVLSNVPLAGFVASILSSRDDTSLVHAALQLVELLCQKLPHVYKSLLRREGVMWEISDIASQAPSNAKYTSKTAAHGTTAAAGTPSSQSSAQTPQAPGSGLALPGTSAASPNNANVTPTSAVRTDTSPTPATPGSGPALLASLMATAASTTTTPVAKRAVAATAEGAKDALIWRARILRDVFNREAANAEGGADHAEKSLANIKALVASLHKAANTDASAVKAALRSIMALFTRADEPISSFELLRSGLVDGLCNFAGGDSPAVPAASRRRLLLETLTAPESQGGTGEGGGAIVRRLQESLSRLENVEIATAINASPDDARRNGTSGLHRQLRLRLQSEDADTPRSCNNLVVGIHAIASFERLSDFLRPKLNTAAAVASLGAGASHNARLSSVLAALAGGSEGGLRSGSALAAALAGRNASTSTTAGAGEGTSAQSAPTSTAPRDSNAGAAASPTPRRSSRLSGKGSESSLEQQAKEVLQAAEKGDTAHSADETSVTDKQAESSSSTSAIERRESGAGGTATLDALAEREGLTPRELAEQIMEGLMPEEYDEDEEMSDAEMEPQIFEDELGPGGELAGSPVQDKTVNLSVADNGQKVEAKTPDGTRIETPSPATPAAAGPSSGGSSSPARPSYAAALQRKPSDFHLQFSMNGRKLNLDSTIYAAVHKIETTAQNASSADSGVASGSSFLQRSIWNNVYTVKFKKVDGPAPATVAKEQTPEPSAGDQSVLTTLPASIASSSPFAKILQLLHILHDLNSEWRASRPGDLTNVDRSSAISEAAFVNHKLTAKLNRQLEEPMIVASKCLPEWSLQLPRNFPFLFPFEARYAFLQSTAFGYNRMLQRWQNIANRNNDESGNSSSSSSRLMSDTLAHLVRLPRAKVRIARDNLLPSAFRVMELYGKEDTILEVEYFNEVGTGLGPTLEFYSLASKEFARKNLQMWRENGPADSDSPYVYAPDGLFPLPISPAEAKSNRGQGRLTAFRIIGQFVAKALLDSRIIDCNFSPIFMRAVLNQRFTPSLATLRAVDATLAKSLAALQSMSPDDLAGLHLDFTLPGDGDFEVVPDGKSKSVDAGNVAEYIDAVAEAVLGSGIRPLVKAFRFGFNQVFPIAAMTSFTADELVMLFGNTEEDWSEATLQTAIKPDHGYNSESPTFKDLLSIMATYKLNERREFLQWLTGSPKLPIGGFAGLQPRLTVVKRPAEAPLKPDDYLASNMSCANFLKLPQYSTREIMKKRLETAVREGAGSFDLS